MKVNFFRRKLKSLFDSIGNRNFKKKILNALPFWAGALITGVVSVLYAKIFSFAEEGTAYIFAKDARLFFILTPLCFLIAWWLVQKYSPFSRGSGIPQVSAAIELSNPKHYYKVNKLLSIRVIVVKIVSSLFLVFGGGVTGREGPTIQIAASIFKKINDILPKWYPKISKMNMIVTGAAAGLAAAFNTPLGGIVFAIEELTKTHFSYFKSALLTGVIIAGLTALHFLGPYLYLGYPQLNGVSSSLILIAIPVAIVTGIGGSGMGRIILYIFKKKQKLTKNYQRILYVLFCGLILAAIGYFLDSRAFGSGKEIMTTALFTNEKHVSWQLCVLRFIGPIITFSTGAAGGVFAPSLTAGAGIGAFAASLFHLPAASANLIILCGMAGFLTGITRSPFTCSILVLEMTNTHNIIFYIMLTALAANLASNFVSRHSFYDHLKDQYIREIHRLEVQQAAIDEERKAADIKEE
jgi:H+/Cl- antiporter ClcA